MPRLKSLDEFEPPPWKGRMARVERRRKLAWWAMMAGAVMIGAAIGLMLL
jgi:type VI protein secretion system component VasF